jgi:AraC-like DNA-binding protein
MCHYMPTRASYLNCSIELPRGAIHIVMAHDDEMLPFLQRSCETLAVIFQTYIESAGGTAAPTVWRFPYRPPANRTDYNVWLHGGYTFGAAVLRLEVPVSVGMVPSAFRNDAAYQSSVAQCEAILQRASTNPLVDRVRGILASHIEQRAGEDYPVTDIPSADEVAEQLQISRRTLIRRLKESGASFQSLKDELLARQIEALIGQETLSMAEIANRLGYTDAANFTRACRRMFGVAPRELRGG